MRLPPKLRVEKIPVKKKKAREKKEKKEIRATV